MKFAIAIPQSYPSPTGIQRFLQRAEDLPFAAAWCIEQVIGTAPVLESDEPGVCGCTDETATTWNRGSLDRPAQSD